MLAARFPQIQLTWIIKALGWRNRFLVTGMLRTLCFPLCERSSYHCRFTER